MDTRQNGVHADTTATTTRSATARAATAWGAVAVMTATSFALATGEFLPPGLLPAMAASLRVTEGQAGQAVTATALAALVTAPVLGLALPRLERRSVLAALALAATVSNVAVALSGELVVVLIARVLLGAAIGGFWAMSLAVAARLSAERHLGRAITLVNVGGTMATVAGVPLGLWIGSFADWRTVFLGVGALTLVAAIGLRAALPAVPPGDATGFRALGATLRMPGVARGLIGHLLVMLGNFAAFTYIRSGLALTGGLDAGGVALLLAVFGVGSVLGGLVTGALADRHLTALRRVAPVVLAIGIAGVVVFAGSLGAVVVAIVVWGAVFGGWLIVVTAWIGRVAPSRLESGGGLVVAGYQLAITLGAGLGGVVADRFGIATTLLAAATAALAGGVVFGTAPGRLRRPR